MTAAIRARGRERDEAEAALRGADQQKDHFLAMLGHELRNPVAAIAAGVQMWKEESQNPDSQKLVCEVIDRQTGNLRRLVDDLLDVARITTGKIELRKRPVDVRELIDHAVDAARATIEDRHHQLEVSYPEAPVAWIVADPTRMEQVLANLLTNAAKYTPDGGHISVVARVERDDVVLLVRDNGIGLRPEELKAIFGLFTQADSSLHRTSGGLGIGLSLSRQLVELHGGSILARSEGLGCGAEFTVRLPAAPAPLPGEAPAALPAADAAARTPTPFCARRILLVDDNQDSTRLLSQLLRRRGHEVCVAFDGRSGFEAAGEFKPDVLILDIGLPEIDGYELARRLRAAGFREALVIALSGYAQEQDRTTALEAGFDQHFAKPVDVDTLTALLREPPVKAAPTARVAG
jgi:CheY-like chemotaxis protein